MIVSEEERTYKWPDINAPSWLTWKAFSEEKLSNNKLREWLKLFRKTVLRKHARIGLYNSMEDTDLARAIDVVMTWAKRIYILIIKVNKLFFFSRRVVF